MCALKVHGSVISGVCCCRLLISPDDVERLCQTLDLQQLQQLVEAAAADGVKQAARAALLKVCYTPAAQHANPKQTLHETSLDEERVGASMHARWRCVCLAEAVVAVCFGSILPAARRPSLTPPWGVFAGSALLFFPLQDALIQLEEREAEEARQKELKKQEAEAALKVHVVRGWG